MTATTLVGADNYFEDFTAGRRFRHWRGKTITDLETMTLCTLVMNTAHGHFNEHAMRDSEFQAPIAFGGVVASIVYGIASQDTAEQAVREEGIESIRFLRPAKTGDTLYVVTEVLSTEAGDDPTCGRVHFRHLGFNDRDEPVCQIVRRVLLRRRPTVYNAR